MPLLVTALTTPPVASAILRLEARGLNLHLAHELERDGTLTAERAAANVGDLDAVDNERVLRTARAIDRMPPTPALPAFGSGRTPGATWSSEWKLRPFGVLSKNCSVMLVEALLEVTSIESLLPTMVTASATLPAASVTSTRLALPRVTLTSSFFTVLKPCVGDGHSLDAGGNFGEDRGAFTIGDRLERPDHRGARNGDFRTRDWRRRPDP